MQLQADKPKVAAPLPGLTRRRKAAMIVQLLINEGSAFSLSDLPEHIQESLTEELGKIRLVDRDTLNAVAGEFADILESIGLSAPGGIAAALAALTDHISPTLARKLQSQLDAQKGSDPWVRILSLDDTDLNPILTSESVEVGAVLLSKLPVDRAAKILGMVPGELARRITFAVSQTETVQPAVVARIGAGLVDDYCKTVVTAFEKPPVARVGAILNSSPAAIRDDMLDSLDSEDAEFAKSVRKAIFTFLDIPSRLKPIDIASCLRAIDPDELTRAIAAALAAGDELANAAEFILANISQRMAGQIREDAAEAGTPKQAVGEEAMNAVTAAIRQLADDGTITLIETETDDEDTA